MQGGAAGSADPAARVCRAGGLTWTSLSPGSCVTSPVVSAGGAPGAAGGHGLAGSPAPGVPVSPVRVGVVCGGTGATARGQARLLSQDGGRGLPAPQVSPHQQF